MSQETSSRTRSGALILTALALGFFPGESAAIIYNSGDVVEITTDTSATADVRDSGLGQPTTLNAFSGAGFTVVSIRNFSVANLLVGFVASSSVRGFDNSTVRIYGGAADFVDSNSNSSVFIDGGSFATTGGVVRMFGGEVQITGGTFQKLTGGSTIQVNGSSELRMCGGVLLPDTVGNGTIDVQGSALIEGGTFNNLDVTSTATLYGSNFEARDTSNVVVLAGPGSLENFTGTITGTLADQSPLATDAFVPIGGLIQLADPLMTSICVPLPPPPTIGGIPVPFPYWALGALGALLGVALVGTRRLRKVERGPARPA